MSINLPTEFAKAICKECDLYPKVEPYEMEDVKEASFWKNMQFLLKEYQKMCLFSKFEVAMYIYAGITLDEEQLKALQLINKLTKEWAKGQVGYNLLEASQDSRIAAHAGGLLLEHIHGAPGELKSNDKKTKMLIVKEYKGLAK